MESRFDFKGKVWREIVPEMDKDGNESIVWNAVPITSVPVPCLLEEWEELVHELSEKEVRVTILKEYIQSQSFHIETTFDFKEAYGKNNADIRKHHIQVELKEVFDEVKDLELGIAWIRSYIPLLRECIKVKHNSQRPIVLDGSHMSEDDFKRIAKALEELKQ